MISYIKGVLLIGILVSSKLLIAQGEEQEKYIKKALGVKEIIWDDYNQDGVFVAQIKETKKWGMYQQIEAGRKPKTLVAPSYDSLGFYKVNGSFTIAIKKGKYCVVGDPWGEKRAKLNVSCKYQKIVHSKDHSQIVACKRNDKWGYLNGNTGDTLIPFIYDGLENLPYARSSFIKHPMKEYPQELLDIIADPLKFEEINLKGLGLTFLPSEIAKCKNAKLINLENNNLLALPDELFELTQLEKLYLGNNSRMKYFPKEFSKLVNLNTLYIGIYRGYSGTYKYIPYEEYEFEEGFSIPNLEHLIIKGYFTGGDIPQFIYELNDLVELSIETNKVFDDLDKFDVSKLKSKDKLLYLTVSSLHNTDILNESLPALKNLKKLYLTTFYKQNLLTAINHLDSLEYMVVTGYNGVKDDRGYYHGDQVIDEYRYGGPYTPEEKKEILIKWNEFMEKAIVPK